jgi:hypothetical protein
LYLDEHIPAPLISETSYGTYQTLGHSGISFKLTSLVLCVLDLLPVPHCCVAGNTSDSLLPTKEVRQKKKINGFWALTMTKAQVKMFTWIMSLIKRFRESSCHSRSQASLSGRAGIKPMPVGFQRLKDIFYTTIISHHFFFCFF